jgi:hypothetical protein
MSNDYLYVLSILETASKYFPKLPITFLGTELKKKLCDEGKWR